MKKRSVSLFLGLTILTSLFFCQTGFGGTVRQGFESAPPPPKGYALVYLYRVKASFGRTPKIVVDGDDVTKLPNNAYTWFYASPGSHSIRTKWGFMAEIPEIESVINVLPGETYFVKLHGKKMAWGLNATKVAIGIKSVSAAEAMKDLKKAKKYYPAMVETVGGGAGAAGLTKKSSDKVARSPFELAPPPPPGYGLVYVYRPDCPPTLRGARIVVGADEVAKLSNKAYTWFYLKEGPHNLSTNWGKIYKGVPKVDVTLNVVAGESYYFRLTGTKVPQYSYDAHTSSLDQVTGNLANKEMPRLKKYVPAEKQQVDQIQ